jgi:hypothetical protein
MRPKGIKYVVALALTMGAAAPALSQTATDPATQAFNTICELDLSVLPIAFGPGERTQFTTFDTRTLCTGSAPNENIKRECTTVIPGWTRGSVSASNFVCTINPDFCDLAASASDPNAPFVTATASQLSVNTSGVAKLTCFYKP